MSLQPGRPIGTTCSESPLIFVLRKHAENKVQETFLVLRFEVKSRIKNCVLASTHLGVLTTVAAPTAQNESLKTIVLAQQGTKILCCVVRRQDTAIEFQQ
jgi:hypothetical protein